MIDKPLLLDIYYAAPEFWHIVFAFLTVLIAFAIAEIFKILKLRQKNYFLNRDRERYAETLYASRDGYFAFIYPDQKVNDPRKHIVERCSRRLAVIMNLSGGTKSGFEDILKNFYKEDVKRIRKYVDFLHEEGVSFDDEFALKSSNKHLRLVGARINGADGNIYCDMIWFRDVSFETNKIMELENGRRAISDELRRARDLIDNLPFPVWLRGSNLKIIDYNKKFGDYLSKSRGGGFDSENEITTSSGDSVSKNLAQKAQDSNKPQNATVSIVKGGQRIMMKAFETPFHAEENLESIYTAGTLVDVNELEELKRNLKLYQSAQLEILRTLGTAFAVFDQHFKLAFHNSSFAELWKLDPKWLDGTPTYSAFLDAIREKRLLPEVPDYLLFKAEEQKKFSQIIEPQKDMLHLPDGTTLRRLRAPYPMGGLIFAYEDISDKLATTSAYNALLSVQQEILENIFDAVLIFGSNGRLTSYNEAYLKLWNAERMFLDSEPNLDELLESQKEFLALDVDWEKLKRDIAGHLLSMTTKTFILSRIGGDTLEIAARNLSDGSLIITYRRQ